VLPKRRELLGILLDSFQSVEVTVEDVAAPRRDEEDVRVRDAAASRHQADELGVKDVL